MKIVATTLLPAVDRWNAARSRQFANGASAADFPQQLVRNFRFLLMLSATMGH